MSKTLQIRNSTADFLVFAKGNSRDTIEVRVQDGNVWLTQKAIGQLFDIDRSVVTKHLRKIYDSGELMEDSTCAFFAQVADNGRTYQYQFYSLPAIIAVGYRTNSSRAAEFRQWATRVLETFVRQGYVLDKERLINGKIFDDDYFEHLISEIQEIRASERRFYQKITDLYATSADYDRNSKTTKTFFATVQNKMHYAVHHSTAAELIMERASHKSVNMGLVTWKNAPAGKMLGTGDPGYTISAEFVYPKYFHKRGALAAARQGDQVNPEKASSGSQFYIVTGKVFNPGQIDQLERQMQMQQEQSVFQSLAANHREEIMNMRRNRDMQGLQALQDTLIAQTHEQIKKEGKRTLTQAQREAYTTVGGTPHLDGEYTVFGEVVDGMEVVDKIQQVETGSADRPKTDVKIMKMKVVK